MTRKHFNAIAKHLYLEVAAACRRGDVEQFRAVNNLCRNMADVCAQSSDTFDRGRFYTACGLASDGFGLPVDGPTATERFATEGAR